MRRPLILSLLLMTIALASAREQLVYVGTYTKTTSKGIYVGRFDPATGRLGELTLAGEMSDPSFLALSPDNLHLYAVSEGATSSYAGKPSGTVNAFALNPKTGALSPIGHAASGGRGPCHLSVAPDGQSVFVANYGSGTVAMLPVLAGGGVGEPSCVIRHEGKGVHPTRQKQPYAHSITLSPDGRFAYAADLGNDTLYTDRVDTAAGTLTPAGELKISPGSGPRHLALHPDGRHAYLINELANTITALSRDLDSGKFEAVQTVTTLPASFTGASTAAEVVVHPSGRFVYASNRGRNSITVFGADPATGRLTPVEDVSTEGKNPRNFAVDATGRWLIAANQDSDSLVIFAVNPDTGRLTPTSQKATLGMPVCIKFR